MRTTRYLVPTLILTVLLSGCGGDDGASGAAGADGLSTLMAVRAEAPGANCAIGGSRIEAGLDADGNGTLGASEVSSTQYMCSGAAGSSAVNTLVQMLAEPSGPNCAAGSKAIKLGSDSNANGVLDAQELSSTQYVCNGTNGTNGANGANGTNGANGANGAAGSNGLNTLLSIVSEPAGANCAYGGSKIATGLDANANNVLDAGEISTSYVCTGAPGATLNWVDVSAATVQAQSNTGYIASNDAAQVVVTLPATPNPGDVVRVAGAGAGGWKIAQNAGQAVYTSNLGGMVGATWTARESDRDWSSVASSADGSKLVAVARTGGQIYTSNNSGVTWTPRAFGGSWTSVASSADGNKLVAVVNTGQIYTSTDSGLNWEERPTDALRTDGNWYSLASSADGRNLVVVVYGGQIWTSDNGGETWIPRDTNRAWLSVASSANGSKLVAVEYGGKIYTSIDSGATWDERESDRFWQSVASSADGSKLVAVDDGGGGGGGGGKIYTSTDSGLTWTAGESDRQWRSVASSADGSKLVAVDNGGKIHTSINSGLIWTESASAGDFSWRSVASSADGNKLVAVVDEGQIYSTASTTPGSGGSISGRSSDAIELIYLGNGIFSVLSHEGSLTIQ